MCTCNLNLVPCLMVIGADIKEVLIRIPQAIRRQFSPNVT